MMEWIALLLVSGLFCAGAYFSYSEQAREQWWFIPTTVGMGTICSLVWFSMVKYLDDKQRIYVYSLVWDAVFLAVYYFLPPLLFGVKLDRWSLLGLALIVIGVAVIKSRT